MPTDNRAIPRMIWRRRLALLPQAAAGLGLIVLVLGLAWTRSVGTTSLVTGKVAGYERSQSDLRGSPYVLVELGSGQVVRAHSSRIVPIAIGEPARLAETHSWPLTRPAYRFLGYLP